MGLSGKISFLSVFALAVVAFSVLAAATMMIPANENAKDSAPAPQYSPAIDESWGLERVDFIHYAKPAGTASTGNPNACFKLMGVKWNPLPVSYAINPSNPQNLSPEFVASSISTSAETWDSATSAELFNNVYSVDYSAQYGVQNYQNAIAFGSYPQNNVIAVTSVWYTRVGKRIVEFDMLFNTNYLWGDASANASFMDLENIATHELGHAAGLSDIYSTSCNTVTMYGYSGYGETSKRTLEAPDVAGLQKMYGA